MSNPKFQHEHFRQLAQWLVLESKAETEKLQQDLQRVSPQEAEQSGNSLIQLTVRDETSGLGGRLLLTMGKRNQQQDLPWTRLRVGTPVQLTSEATATETGWRGVVSQLRRSTIEVALDQWPEGLAGDDTFRLDWASDEISRRRQEAALQQADGAKGNRLAELRSILLGQTEPRFDSPLASAQQTSTQQSSPPPASAQPSRTDGEFTPLSSSLNPTQLEAVQHALNAQDVAIIHGPPGTGKTTTVVELIRQAVQRGDKVLATAPSNLAVDNIFERLLDAPEFADGSSVLRMGHPARVLPQLREQTLEVLVQNHPDMAVARKLHKDAAAVRNQAGKWSRAKPERGARQQQRSEARAMVDDARRMERQLVERILDGAKIICATTSGLDARFMGNRSFDLCIIDEAAQSTEPGNWVPLLYSQRLVLAGDHQQLPPTIISRKAQTEGFGISLMERLVGHAVSLSKDVRHAVSLSNDIAKLLTTQYRMHQSIMDFSSKEFYAGALMADDTVKAHLLCELVNVAETDLTSTPIHFIDTAGADYTEEDEPDGESRFNPQEALLVQRKLDQLLDAGLAPESVAVIAPYSAQVRHLREVLGAQLEAGVEVGSIDGFQGREKEAIIISLVRSNSDGQIGFLADTRRTNVALTRARRKLIVIGDSATIGGDPFYGRLLDYFDRIGAYHTVWEED